MLRQFWTTVRCFWYHHSYVYALNRLVIREAIETFPGGGTTYAHPFLRRQSLPRLGARVERKLRILLAAGCPLPPSISDQYWVIGSLRHLRQEAQEDRHA